MRILITGAASGIMFNLAQKLENKGHLVYLTTHTKSECDKLKQEIKKEKLKMLCFKMDITKAKDRELINKLEFDVFISNAAVGYSGSLLEMDIDVLRKNYEINVFSSFELIKEVYHKWNKTNHPGKIFVTGSQFSMLPFPFLGCYTSTKASLSILVNTIRRELQYLNSNITITLITPFAYHTGFNQVMIENKEKYLYKDGIFYQNIDSINKIQKNIFTLIESNNIDKLTNKILKEIESNNPKNKIVCPIFSNIFLKIYSFFVL